LIVYNGTLGRAEYGDIPGVMMALHVDGIMSSAYTVIFILTGKI
jgi:hypothetical protein